MDWLGKIRPRIDPLDAYLIQALKSSELHLLVDLDNVLPEAIPTKIGMPDLLPEESPSSAEEASDKQMIAILSAMFDTLKTYTLLQQNDEWETTKHKIRMVLGAEDIDVVQEDFIEQVSNLYLLEMQEALGKLYRDQSTEAKEELLQTIWHHQSHGGVKGDGLLELPYNFNVMDKLEVQDIEGHGLEEICLTISRKAGEKVARAILESIRKDPPAATILNQTGRGR